MLSDVSSAVLHYGVVATVHNDFLRVRVRLLHFLNVVSYNRRTDIGMGDSTV